MNRKQNRGGDVESGLASSLGAAPSSLRPIRDRAANASQKSFPAKRTTRVSQKLALFPTESTNQLNASFPRDGNASAFATTRSETQRMLSDLDKGRLPRSTAYCISSGLKVEALVDYLISKRASHGCAPKRFDEVIYTPITNVLGRRAVPQAIAPVYNSMDSPLDQLASTPPDTDALFDEAAGPSTRSPSAEDVPEPFSPILEKDNLKFDLPLSSGASVGHLFLFEYGVVVMWGLSLAEETAILREIDPFLEGKLPKADVETEDFHFVSGAYQPRIWNDIILLKNPNNYMILLTISHAMAQSVKLALFEGQVELTIDSTKHLPRTMASTGKVSLSNKSITKKIGELFIQRININLVEGFLDTPDIFWSEPALEPFYKAIRAYLEIGQRVDVLNQRVNVISDLLEMLKDYSQTSHSEYLEWIVIILIFVEILIGLATMGFDLLS